MFKASLIQDGLTFYKYPVAIQNSCIEYRCPTEYMVMFWFANCQSSNHHAKYPMLGPPCVGGLTHFFEENQKKGHQPHNVLLKIQTGRSQTTCALMKLNKGGQAHALLLRDTEFLVFATLFAGVVLFILPFDLE